MTENSAEILGVFLSRLQLATGLGMSFNGQRDIYTALGYPKEIEYKDYLERYKRQEIAQAIIDRPIRASWDGEISVLSNDKTDKLQNGWIDLEKSLNLKENLMTLDRLTGLGHYGILFLGFADVQQASHLKTPVNNGSKLLFVRPFSESTAKIQELVKSTSDKRFGKPEHYQISFTTGESVLVHHSRVIHIVDNSLETTNEGKPRLEAVYNRLMDLEKIVGGDAEMFWRGARPGYSGKVDKDFAMTDTAKTDLQKQVNEYENDLIRILINEGVDLKALTQQVADPTNHVDVQIQMISSQTGIPKRILTGSEIGQLSSTQDLANWLSFIKTRREQFNEPKILRPFIEKCQQYKVLPAGDFAVKFSDLFSNSLKQTVEIGNMRATAIKSYLTAPGAEIVLPPHEFLKYALGFTDEEIINIEESKKP